MHHCHDADSNIRVALNYKGVPFKTEWVEYPDIEPVMKKIGSAPTMKNSDGQDLYTLPAIHDSDTAKVVTNSLDISEYLDEKYPDKPLLFPPGTRAAIELFRYTLNRTVLDPLADLVIPRVIYNLNPRSEEFYRRTREVSYGCTMEEISPPGPKRDELWANLQKHMTQYAAWYDENGPGKLFFFGDTFSFADAIMIGNILWAEKALGPTSDEYKMLTSWDGGRWGELVEATRQYSSA